MSITILSYFLFYDARRYYNYDKDIWQYHNQIIRLSRFVFELEFELPDQIICPPCNLYHLKLDNLRAPLRMRSMRTGNC